VADEENVKRTDPTATLALELNQQDSEPANDGGSSGGRVRSTDRVGGRLQLPTAGHVPARRLLLAGIAFYVAFAAVLAVGIAKAGDAGIVLAVKELLGLEASWTMFLLVVVGIAVFIGATLLVYQDIRWLANEEQDIEFLLRNPKAPTLVLVDQSKRGQLLRQRIFDADPSQWGSVETILDDRVRRFVSRQNDRSVHFSPEELRILAEQRTGRVGVNARYASALLLLLAVLGTFSGVKSALPELIQAAGAATSQGGAGTGMVDALREVAGAFGANSLALLAAIAVSVMSQGLSIGRRNFLERLEHASEPLFSGVGGASSGDPLTNAMEALRGSADVMSGTAGSIRNLESVVNDLSTTFRDSFQELTQQLQDLALQQERSMHEKTAQEFSALQVAVQEMSEMVEQVIRANTTLVETIGRQHQESRDTITAATAVYSSLDRGVAGVTALNEVASRAAVEVGAGLDRMRLSSEEVVQRLLAAASSMDRVQPGLQGLEQLMQQAMAQFGSGEKAAAAAWTKAAQDVTQRMERVLKQAAADRSALLSGGGGGGGVEGRHPLMQGFLQGAGIVAVLGVTWVAVEIGLRVTGR